MKGSISKYLTVVGAACVVSLGARQANAAAIEFAFTGTVDYTYGSYAFAQGQQITGTFTLEYDSAIPSQQIGTVGSDGVWELRANGGSSSGQPVPAGQMFSMTATVAGQTFTTPPISSYFNSSSIEGDDFYPGAHTLSAMTQVAADSTSPNNSSDIALFTDNGGVFPWLSNGYPNLSNLDMSKSGGSFDLYYPNFSAADGMNFNFDSLTLLSPIPPGGSPVPLPAAVWLLISGVLGVSPLWKRSRSQAP